MARLSGPERDALLDPDTGRTATGTADPETGDRDTIPTIRFSFCSCKGIR